MTLQQLKYVIQIVQSGSISGAAQKLFITQPSLSKAVTDLEKEMGITIFCRNNRGVYLSEEGTRFLAYARQVVEQAQLLEQKYKKGTPVRRVFAISAQHYAFVVNAFVELIKEYGKNKYEFSLRESRTSDIIEDVRTKRSELGILFLNDFNHDVMMRMFEKAELSFVPLFFGQDLSCISFSRKKVPPGPGKEKVAMADLQDYPRLTYEQGNQ